MLQALSAAPDYTAAMNAAKALLPALLLTLGCTAAQAQWAWRDKDGNRVFSDQPPPASVPDKDILRKPDGSAGAGALQPLATDALKPAPGAPAAAARPAGPNGPSEKELDERRRQAEAADTARKKAAADQLAKDRAENCLRATQAKTTYESGVRIARTNAQGEREILDDAGREAELKRVQGVIDKDCAKK